MRQNIGGHEHCFIFSQYQAIGRLTISIHIITQANAMRRDTFFTLIMLQVLSILSITLDAGILTGEEYL